MNNGIGDYIHWHKYNYINYGLYHAKKGTKKVQIKNANNIFYSAQKQIVSRAKSLLDKNTSDKTLKKMEDFLTGVYFNDKTKQVTEEERKIFMKEIKKYFDKFESGTGFQLNITNNVPRVEYKYGTRTKEIETKAYSENSANKLLKKIDEAKKNLNRMVNDYLSDPVDIAKYQKTLKLIEKFYKTVTNAIKTMQKNGDSSFTISNNDKEALNEVYRFSYMVPYRAYGDLGEIIGAAGARTLQKGAAKSTKQIVNHMKTIMKGAETTSTKIDASAFDKHLVDLDTVFQEAMAKGSIKKKGNLSAGISYEIQETQQKADIVFTIEDAKYSTSVKYMGQKSKKMKLVSGASTLSILNDEPSNLVNHWLNLVVQGVDRYDEQKKVYLTDISNKFNTAKRISIETVKLIATLKALTGQLSGRKGVASTVLIIDAKTKKVYFKKMSTILNKIMKNKKILDTYIDFGNKNIFASYPIGDFSNSNAGARISNILGQLAKEKITAHMNADIFRSV